MMLLMKIKKEVEKYRNWGRRPFQIRQLGVLTMDGFGAEV